jgi:phospholipid-binding lipoprotein MlaA
VPPLLAPGSLRDHTGTMVDMFADPLRMWLMNTDREGWYYARSGITLIDQRDGLIEALADLKKSSLDYYATVRSAYVQRRSALVRDEAATDGGADIPNYSAGM